LAGKVVTLYTAEGASEGLTLNSDGTFQSDINASGTYILKTGAGGVELDLDYNAPQEYSNDHYELVLNYDAASGTGTFAGNLYFGGANHSVSGTIGIR
jgi:hypothetical protein